MSSPSDKPKGLSSNLLNMRFMRRREETELREKLRKEEERRLLEARWVVKSKDDDNVILIMSEDRFDLSPPLGRRSFKGFNAALETLVETQLREHRQRQGRQQKRRASLADQDEADAVAVSDDSMTAFALASKRKR